MPSRKLAVYTQYRWLFRCGSILAFPRGEGAPKGRMRAGVHRQSGIGLRQSLKSWITARIPHQSKIVSLEPIFASFPPGEAKWRSRAGAINYNLIYPSLPASAGFHHGQFGIACFPGHRLLFICVHVHPSRVYPIRKSEAICKKGTFSEENVPFLFIPEFHERSAWLR